MHRFEPGHDDVVMMDTSQTLVPNSPTFRVNQLKLMLKDRFKNIFNTGSLVLDEGVDC